MDKYTVRLYGGLGDGFLHMYTRKPHRCLKDIKYKHPDAQVIVDVVSNNLDLTQLYKYNPLVSNCVYTDQTSYIVKHAPLELKYNIDFSKYEESDPEFYLTTEEQCLVDSISSQPFVFMHLYSSTPRKKIIDELQNTRLLEEILQRGYQIAYFGKSHKFDQHSHNRGYPSCNETFDLYVKGIYNFTIEPWLKYNNPRVGWHLCKRAHSCIVAESAYLQAATYLNKRLFILLGSGMYHAYKNDIKNEYYKAFHRPGNMYLDVMNFNLELLEKFYGS